MHTIEPARLKPGVSTADLAERPADPAAPASAGRVITCKALIFWDPMSLPGTRLAKKLDAIDTDQITPAADCVSESLDTLDERWKAGSFRYLMPDFRARVHRGETFVIAGERFAIGSSREMSPAGLKAIAEEVGAPQKAPVQAQEKYPRPSGEAITPEAAAAAVGTLLPEGAIVVDEALTAAAAFLSRTRGAASHDCLQVTGGAIGIGLPLATGAAVACPDRKVVCLQADGSAMYTVQALWTQAREGLDVTTLLLNNRSYAILKQELANFGAEEAGRRALDMMELDRPALDWVGLARGMGVEAEHATTVVELDRQFAAGLRSEGPYLIDLVL